MRIFLFLFKQQKETKLLVFLCIVYLLELLTSLFLKTLIVSLGTNDQYYLFCSQTEKKKRHVR